MADENVVQVLFTGDIYDLQEKGDAAKDQIDAFTEAVKADLEAAAAASQSAGESAREGANEGPGPDLEPQQYDELGASAGRAAHSVSSLAKATHLASRVFLEKGNEVGKTAMEIRHLVHSATLAQHSLTGVAAAIRSVSLAQVAALATNPWALLAAGVVALGAGIYTYLKSFEEGGDEAEKHGKKFERMWGMVRGEGIKQVNVDEEIKDNLSKAQKAYSEAREESDEASSGLKGKMRLVNLKNFFTGNWNEEETEKKFREEAAEKLNKAKEKLENITAREEEQKTLKRHEAAQRTHAVNQHIVSQRTSDFEESAVKAREMALLEKKGTEEADKLYEEAIQESIDKRQLAATRKLEGRKKSLALEESSLGQDVQKTRLLKLLHDLGPNATKEQYAEAEKVAARESTLEINKYLDQQDKALQRHRDELDMTSTAAKRHAEEEALLDKYGVKRGTAEGDSLLKRLSDSREDRLSDAMRDGNEALEERRAQLSMTSQKAREYAEDSARLKQLGLTREDAAAAEILARQEAGREVKRQESLKSAIEGIEDEIKAVTKAADAYQLYSAAKQAGILGDEEKTRELMVKQEELRVAKMKQSVTMPGQKEFEEEVQRIARLRDQFTDDEAALLLDQAEKKFAPETWRASFSGVADTWTRMQTSAASPQDQQLKATRDLARAIELKHMDAAEQRTLLEAIPTAIAKINGQRP